MSEIPKSEAEPASVEGTSPPLTDDAMRARAMDLAFDYRGDVTLELTDGRTLEGYVCNRHADAVEPFVKMMLKTGGEAGVRYAEVARLIFSGKDTAAGRSWQNWVRRYVEKKLAGEATNIQAEVLD